MREQASFDVTARAPLYPYMDANTTAACLRALFDDSPVAIVALDSEYRSVMCNRAFEVLYQFSQKELMASDLDELITAPDTLHEAKDLSDAVLRGEKVHLVSQRRRKDGMTVDVEIHGIPLMVNGTLSGVIALYQDVTERNRAQAAVRQISDKLDNLQQEERRRVARDLHDSTSQELAVLNWNLTQLITMVDGKNTRLLELVMQTKKLAAQCSSGIRSAAYLLHPPMLGKEGLHTVVRRLGEEFEQRSGIRVNVDVPPSFPCPSEAVEVAVFRVLQEALANVLRHSGSPVVHVSLSLRCNWVTLLVSDEGKKRLSEGTHSLKCRPPGVGVAGMRERLEELGGHLMIEQTEQGTTVVATVPSGVQT